VEDPPLPPPPPRRPFNWRNDAPEWGEDSLDEDLVGCLFVLLAGALMALGMVLLWALR